jgi:DNA adenine methylase
MSIEMRTPITYYGGKQKLCGKIVGMLPEHTLYCEPFFGGGAVFFAKKPSPVEVINDTNKELINYYRVVKNDFVALEQEIRISLHARDLHRKARVIYENPDMFNEIKRAWALWTLATQSFASIIDGSWGYDKAKNTTSKKIANKRDSFTEDYSIRLQLVQIECTDAIRIIESRDGADSFFYLDPPYFNSDCGHYDGYTLEDFENLLKVCKSMKGRFLLSSYPSPILDTYAKKCKWSQQQYVMEVTVANNSPKGRKKKVEMLTANYDLSGF